MGKFQGNLVTTQFYQTGFRHGLTGPRIRVKGLCTNNNAITQPFFFLYELYLYVGVLINCSSARISLFVHVRSRRSLRCFHIVRSCHLRKQMRPNYCVCVGGRGENAIWWTPVALNKQVRITGFRSSCCACKFAQENLITQAYKLRESFTAITKFHVLRNTAPHHHHKKITWYERVKCSLNFRNRFYFFTKQWLKNPFLCLGGSGIKRRPRSRLS